MKQVNFNHLNLSLNEVLSRQDMKKIRGGYGGGGGGASQCSATCICLVPANCGTFDISCPTNTASCAASDGDGIDCDGTITTCASICNRECTIV